VIPSQPICSTPLDQGCTPITIHPISQSQPGVPMKQSSGVAKLLRSGYMIDGRKAYRMVDKYDRLLMYVTAGPNVDLEPYVFRSVDLLGTLSYRGDYRANYMVVDTIVPAP
jgi:hypothetical protein